MFLGIFRDRWMRQLDDGERHPLGLGSGCDLAASPRDRSKAPLEACQILRDGPVRGALHGPIGMDHFSAEFSERRRPASATTQCCRDDRFAKLCVHAVDEQPCGSIRHLHPARGLADRSAIANRLQDLDFSRAKRTIGRQVEPEEYACHIDMLRPVSHPAQPGIRQPRRLQSRTGLIYRQRWRRFTLVVLAWLWRSITNNIALSTRRAYHAVHARRTSRGAD